MWNLFKNNWIKISITITGLVIFLVFAGCEPKVKSLFNDDQLITGPELKVELETLLSTAKLRQEDLQRQTQLRNLILKNVLIVAESGSLNPVGLLTALFAFYGFGSAANSTKNAVKKKLSNHA